MKGTIKFSYRNFSPLIFPFEDRVAMIALINSNKGALYFDVAYILPEEVCLNKRKVKRGKSLKLIDNEGKQYKSIRQAAKEYGLNHFDLAAMLRGKLENTTQLKYFKEKKLKIV